MVLWGGGNCQACGVARSSSSLTGFEDVKL